MNTQTTGDADLLAGGALQLSAFDASLSGFFCTVLRNWFRVLKDQMGVTHPGNDWHFRVVQRSLQCQVIEVSELLDRSPGISVSTDVRHRLKGYRLNYAHPWFDKFTKHVEAEQLRDSGMIHKTPESVLAALIRRASHEAAGRDLGTPLAPEPDYTILQDSLDRSMRFCLRDPPSVPVEVLAKSWSEKICDYEEKCLLDLSS